MTTCTRKTLISLQIFEVWFLQIFIKIVRKAKIWDYAV